MMKDEKNNSNQRQLVLISGPSGVGKSALAHELEEPLEKAKGFFLTGKFDLNQGQEPYAGIVAAVRTLCNILMDSPLFAQVQHKLQEELGNDAHILVQLVPLLSPMFGCNDATTRSQSPRVGVKDAQNQFHFAFVRFLRVISSFGPIVLLMDDIQWSDIASMQLLEVLLTDRSLDMDNFMVVGLYRSNEVHEGHLVTKWMRDVDESKGIAVQKIVLGNLTQTHINQMLVDLLSADSNQTQGLSEIVYKKTAGNVFYVRYYLQSLEDEELLRFNFGLNKWLWDEGEIRASTIATDNVVDLMKGKLARLPSALRQILPLAAFLGTSFSEDILTPLVDQLPNIEEYLVQQSEKERVVTNGGEEGLHDTNAKLRRCVDVGLVEEHPPKSYQWLHDKIQEAALSMIAPERFSELQFRAGEALCGQLDPVQIEEHIFVIVNLLNEHVSLYLPKLTEAKRLRMAGLYLLAGKKANQSASFASGGVYLRRGINLLPKGHWESQYAISLELFSLAAEAELVTGEVEYMERHCNEVIAQEDRPIQDKFRAYYALIESIGGRNRLEEAIEMILSVLAQLGCTFPKRGRKLVTIAGLIKVKATIKDRTPEEIAKQQQMTDPKRIEAMRLMDKLATFAYYAKSELLALSILKRLSWTIKYGVSAFSPPAFSQVGLILCGKLGDIQGGKVYGQHALSMIDKFDCRAVEARTYFVAHATVFHWTIPVHDCMKPALRAYESGMATGDLDSAFWGVFFHLEFAFYAGRPLQSIEADFRFFTKRMKHQKLLVYHSQISSLAWEGILHLLGRSDDPTELCGEVVTPQFICDAEGRQHAGELAMIHRMQIYLAYWFCDDERGAELALRYGEEHPTGSPGNVGVVHVRVHTAVLCLSAGRKTGNKKYIKYGRKVARIVKSWVEKGCPNVVHFDALLDAERCALSRKNHLAVKHFECAALLAARRGFIQDQAMINERFADFALHVMNDEHEAEYRAKESEKLYNEWGALGKVKQVKTKLRQFFREEIPPSDVVVQACVTPVY
ncbi:Transcriptional regulator [Seminavis robusta]|uniref:Transcriptional regulator n=1 Tax=Seminavis robusta TaxID=568900 RepID=A0A9N8EQR5_9STRA|nr:Transcriptional regulator [Seminavis robusta]|eukprot:Sro1430_g271950.1 Transcriptional regulator (1020) ;mRNA; f:13275-16913